MPKNLSRTASRVGALTAAIRTSLLGLSAPLMVVPFMIAIVAIIGVLQTAWWTTIAATILIRRATSALAPLTERR